MKCHAGIEFPQGAPCPKCKAKLGEVCWPGINADLAELPKLRMALENIIQRANESGAGEMALIDTIHAMHKLARDAVTAHSSSIGTEK